MIRENNNGDISDEEYEKVVKPFYENYDEYVSNYIIPEVVAFYIATSYYRNSMYETSFAREYNSAKDLINLCVEDDEEIIIKIKKLLRIKYSLEIINDDPFELKEIKY